MASKGKVAHELIRRVLDGRGEAAARRRLVAMGGDCVEPVLQAMSGRHGPMHPDCAGAAVNDLMKVLAQVAKRDVTPLAEALHHEVPSLNAVIWALGYSDSRHARQLLKHFADHEDGAIRSIVQYHSRKKPRRSSKKKAKKKAAKRKASKKKARKKAAARKR